jgi:hypothetical protein
LALTVGDVVSGGAGLDTLSAADEESWLACGASVGISALIAVSRAGGAFTLGKELANDTS